MAATGALLTIDAPPLTPPPSGLLRSATVIESEDSRFINGETWQGDSCGNARVLDPCSANSKVPNVFADAATTNASTTLTSATANFRVADVGKGISGAGIPAGATIASFTNITTIALSVAATATATGVTITIAGRTASNVRPARREAYAFVVEAHEQCSAFGGPAADYEGRARRALLAKESKAVEGELATSAIMPGNRHFQDTGANTNTSGIATSSLNSGNAVGARTGLSLLVQAIADGNGGIGMIHARPGLVTQWSGLNLLRWQNGLLYTLNGNLVVPGSGYTGAAPDGTAPTLTTQWAYATDLIQIKRGPIEVFASDADLAATLDRSNNSVTVRAERAYVLEFNACVLAGAKIDSSLDVGGFGA